MRFADGCDLEFDLFVFSVKGEGLEVLNAEMASAFVEEMCQIEQPPRGVKTLIIKFDPETREEVYQLK